MDQIQLIIPWAGLKIIFERSFGRLMDSLCARIVIKGRDRRKEAQILFNNFSTGWQRPNEVEKGRQRTYCLFPQGRVGNYYTGFWRIYRCWVSIVGWKIKGRWREISVCKKEGRKEAGKDICDKKRRISGTQFRLRINGQLRWRS